MREFDIISEVFAPLTKDAPGAFNLTDDAAVVDVPPGSRLVASVDLVATGVHFPTDDDPALVARKALRASLSDLAAMGATPRGFLVGLAATGDLDIGWFRRFAEGLSEDQSIFACPLLGGDSITAAGPVTVSITVLGEVPRDGEVRRRGAKVGDRVFVSGSLGAGAFGLLVLQGAFPGAEEAVRTPLIERYRLPEPRLTLGVQLRDLASAAIDVSDGLVADLGHLCTASGVGSVIRWARLPLSAPVRTLLVEDPAKRLMVLGGGDDYEVLFTVPGGRLSLVPPLAERLDLALTEIGEIVLDDHVLVLDEDGKPIEFGCGGYRHF